MKIKNEKKLNLPQLIEYAWDNGIDSRTFTSPKGGDITFDEYGDVVDVYSVNLNDTFTIEVEEEITKDTKLPSALVYDGKYFKAYYGLSINDIEKKFIDYVYRVEKIHLIDGDTHTLIWRDGKLVE